MFKDEIYRAETDLLYVFLKRLEPGPQTWDDLFHEMKSTRPSDDIVKTKDELLRLRCIEQDVDIISITNVGRDYIFDTEDFIDFLKNHCLMAVEQ